MEDCLVLWCFCSGFSLSCVVRCPCLLLVYTAELVDGVYRFRWEVVWADDVDTASWQCEFLAVRKQTLDALADTYMLVTVGCLYVLSYYSR